VAIHNDPLSGARYPDLANATNPPQDIQNAVNDLSGVAVNRYTSTTARDTAYANWVAAGHTMVDGLECNVAGTHYIYRASVWRPIKSSAPLAATTNSVTRSDAIADSWCVFVVSDPGFPYRIKANAIVPTFANGCQMNTMLHVGSTSFGAGSEPTMSTVSNFSNVLGDVLIHPPRLSAVITGTGRITGMAQRDGGSGSGSWNVLGPDVYYEIVPEL
jgi:hypothetical protein